MTLLKDLIPIPERVQRGDFVLNLASGLQKSAIHQTLADYVVTPQLARCFDDALAFIQSAVTGPHNRNKGSYLHGSFGSGKSHFMAVLHLLLQNHPQARAIPELAEAVARHDGWMRDRNILLVPYHMIGAASVEAGILGGYARHIASRHPGTPVPGFYLSEHLFTDAVNLRRDMGDDAFFAALNRAAQPGTDADDWGELAIGWDAASFEAIIHHDAAPEDRHRLVGDLVGSLFRAYERMASSGDGAFVEFDEGLQILSRHARDLGYDAVILFLDELILWLASRLSDRNWINSEIQKVVKLVETGTPRALPMASLIARQRDLREFVGDQYSGVEQEILSDSLKYWEGRFHTITLEDRNLPVIAERRLLRPRDDTARAEIDEAFSRTEKMREEIFSLLLTSQGDRAQFRSLYPFSPALVQALVALSSALQRERTALKVMLMLLVSQRDTLTLGSVIPVGDLYDVIASEAEPFSEQMRQHFEHARNLLERKLIPMLEGEHRATLPHLSARAAEDPTRVAFHNDLRLLKTLLLAALVPEVESFKQLTGNKLAALNHGTIRAPIPGQEGRTVLQKCRRWAGQVGEIKLAEDANPVIGIQLSGVDTESIIEQGRINDNAGNRRRLVEDMVLEAFGIANDHQMFREHPIVWRGTRHRVEVMVETILAISDPRLLQSLGEGWRIIIDYPFDDSGRSPTDKRAVFLSHEDGGLQARTLYWLPYYFSDGVRKNLGKLVVLREILKSDDAYARYSAHLSPQDRASARTLLDNQRSQLREQLRDHLMAAYGVAAPQPGALDNAGLLDEQILCLQPGFTPRLPQGATMDKALAQLLGQALAFQYPAHPEFDMEVRAGDLNKIRAEISRALHAEDHRIEVEAPLRSILRGIAQPLGLGEMHERHFIFKPDWPQHLTRELAREGEEITVARLREAMDRPRARGLPVEVQNLLILVFAEHGQYAFGLHGGPAPEPGLKEIRDELVLVKQALPESGEWKQALEVAGRLFGVSVSPLLTASNQNLLQRAVHEAARDHLDPCRHLAADLEIRYEALGLAPDGDRLRNARLAVAVLEGLREPEGPELVRALARVEPITTLPALARSIASAREIGQTLAGYNWALLELVWGRDDGADIRARVEAALRADELVTGLGGVLRQAQVDATGLIAGKPPQSPGPGPKPAIVKPPPEREVVAQVEEKTLDATGARALLNRLEQELQEGDQVVISYTVYRKNFS